MLEICVTTTFGHLTHFNCNVAMYRVGQARWASVEYQS